MKTFKHKHATLDGKPIIIEAELKGEYWHYECLFNGKTTCHDVMFKEKWVEVKEENMKDVEPFEMVSICGAYFKIDVNSPYLTQRIIMCNGVDKPFGFDICKDNLIDLQDWLHVALER